MREFGIDVKYSLVIGYVETNAIITAEQYLQILQKSLGHNNVCPAGKDVKRPQAINNAIHIRFVVPSDKCESIINSITAILEQSDIEYQEWFQTKALCFLINKLDKKEE